MFIIAVVFSTVAMFIVWLSYKFLIPIWNLTVGPIATQYPSMVDGDSTYISAFNTIVSEVNLLLNYSFVVMGLGIVAVFVLIVAYRKVFGSTLSEEEDYYD